MHDDDKKEWGNLSHAERFGYLWPALVDLLREMEIPFVFAAQLSLEDEKRAAAFNLVSGMDPRIIFAAVLARDGMDGLSKLIPGFGKFEKMNLGEDAGKRKIAELEASDMKMQHLQLPRFMDTMRDIQSEPEDPDGSIYPG
jgi:hypothetical protein